MHLGVDHIQIAADFTAVEIAQHVLVRPIREQNHAFSLVLFSVSFHQCTIHATTLKSRPNEDQFALE